MATSVPSILLYGQALALLQQLQTDYTNGVVGTTDEVASELQTILSKYELNAGTPLVTFEEVEEFEPPLSEKMNRFWGHLIKDISLIQNQLDVLRSTAVFTHNFIQVEIQRSQQQNAVVNNKLKALQLFSSASNPNLQTFGDNFHSSDFIDNALLTGLSLAQVTNGVLTLGQQGNVNDLSQQATITILSTSNGFSGNNQQIDDPARAPINTVTGESQYSFVAETNRAADTAALKDGRPDTWFEYEHYVVPDIARAAASDFNFNYTTIDPSTSTATTVDWGIPPSNGMLELDLQFSLDSAQIMNSVMFTPYGLENNANLPVHIKGVSISPDGTNWGTLDPADIWLATEANLAVAKTAPNIFVGQVVWNFNAQPVQYVQIFLQQPNPITVPIGHLYYLNIANGARELGPIPSATDPSQYYEDPTGGSSDATVHREYFIGQRYAIGVTDVSLQQIQYSTQSTVVSTPWTIGGVVDRVTLDANISVPSAYPSDQSWVQFYVSPDNGSTWYQIGRIKDDLLNIPGVIAFNDPLPPALQDPTVTYYQVTQTVNSIRVKIVLNRPSDQLSSTPVVNSYTLNVLQR